jgi:prefoldin subunit 5
MSEQMQREIANLGAEVDAVDDLRAAFAIVQKRIRALRQDGHVIPADLLRMERNLQSDCISQSRGG